MNIGPTALRLAWFAGGLCLAAAAAPAANRLDAQTLSGPGRDPSALPARRAVVEQSVAQVQQTFYREQYTTEMQDSNQLVYDPVVHYQWTSRWHNWWNPFAEPYVTYQLEPQTVWQPRWQVVRLPVTRRELIPETRTVQVPARRLGFEPLPPDTRLAEAPPPAAPVKTPALVDVPSRQPFGGIARLENDPPRYGTGTSDAGWTSRR